MESPHVITWAGKHSKLGELVARCVIDATTEALAKQTNLTPDSQRDMLVRLDRFGVDEKKYWEVAASFEGENKRDLFIRNLRNFSKIPVVVAMVSSLLHIEDEIGWGLIPELAGKRVALSMMKSLPDVVNTLKKPDFNLILDERFNIIENWIRLSAWCVKCGFSGNVP